MADRLWRADLGVLSVVIVAMVMNRLIKREEAQLIERYAMSIGSIRTRATP